MKQVSGVVGSATKESPRLDLVVEEALPMLHLGEKGQRSREPEQPQRSVNLRKGCCSAIAIRCGQPVPDEYGKAGRVIRGVTARLPHSQSCEPEWALLHKANKKRRKKGENRWKRQLALLILFPTAFLITVAIGVAINSKIVVLGSVLFMVASLVYVCGLWMWRHS